jgi:hypothetical protein
MSKIILTPEVNRYIKENGTIEIVYTDTSVYCGKLNDRDEFHGIGKYLGRFGNYYIGEFNNGKKWGVCVEQWWDIIFEGNYVDNKRDGFGLEIYRDGDYSVGNYINDKRDGVFTFTKPNGSTLTRTYRQGELIIDDGRYIMSKLEQIPQNNIMM